MADSEYALIRALLGDLREDLVELRGDVATRFARLEGAVELLGAVKSADDRRLEEQVGDVRHRGRSTEAVVQALHDRLDTYPPPHVIESTRELAKDNRRRLDRTFWTATGVAAGSAVGGAGIATALLRALGA